MKKNIIKFMLVYSTIFTLGSTITFAAEKNNNKIEQNIVKDCKQETEKKFIKYNGKIEEINKQDGISILVKNNENEYGMMFNISEKVVILDESSTEIIDVKKLKAGDEVTVYYGVNTPSTKSLPPQLIPSVIVLNKEEKNSNNKTPIFNYIDYFDKDGISSDFNICINSIDKTKIFDTNGKNIKIKNDRDILNKNLIVFYNVSTKSIPAKINPLKIIIIDNEQNNIITEEEKEIKEDINKKEKKVLEYIDKENIYKIDNNTFIPLHTIADKLGYSIKWDENTKKITLSKDNITYSLQIGSKNFNCNLKTEEFKNAPFIKNNRTYVEQSFIDKL